MTLFTTAAALANLCPAVTVKAATAAARDNGITIRRDRDADSGYSVYPKGQGDFALFAEDGAEALFLADVMAADFAAGRVSLTRAATTRGVVEVLAARASARYGVKVSGAVVQCDVSGAWKAVFTAPGCFERRAVMPERAALAEIAAAVAPAAESVAMDAEASPLAEIETECDRMAAPRSLSAAAAVPQHVKDAEDSAVTRAAAMRASLPALKAAARSLSRRAAHDPQAARRLAIVESVVELKAGAIPATLAAAFALNVQPRRARRA